MRNEYKILKENCFKIPLNYEYSSLVGINTGLISEKVEYSKLTEDLSSLYDFYTKKIYKVLEKIPSISINISLQNIDLNIWIFLNMYEKENPGILPRLEIFPPDIYFKSDLNYYDLDNFKKRITRKIRTYSRFSNEFLQDIYGGFRPDEDPIRKPENYSEDYILKYYTFHEYPSVEILDKIAIEFPEYDILYDDNKDLMSSTKFLVDNYKKLYKKVIESPEKFSPDCIKLFLSFIRKTL